MNGLVISTKGMVATSQRLATEVGVELLKGGGSAVDAAIGANAMLSLIEPYMCGPGGDLFSIVWDPETRSLQGLNASGHSPRGQTLAELRQRLGSRKVIPVNGVHSITVPGAVRGWAALHERFGRLPLEQIFAPVIEYAKTGVTIGSATAKWWQGCANFVDRELGFNETTHGFFKTFLSDGKPPPVGSSFINTGLAKTYSDIAEQGFGSFYEGKAAERVVNYLGAVGSALTKEDFALVRADWVEPISTKYRGYDVYELPPNGQGLTVLQMLNILENFPIAELGPDSPTYWHYLIEAKKLAFEDRAHFYADPEFSCIPIDALCDKAYAAHRSNLISNIALQHPVHGDPVIAQGDTTYLTVADSTGLMVSLIQSIFVGFGSALVPDGMGFALQSRGAAFSLDEGHPNAYAPGKRPFHTIIPAFVMYDGSPLLSFGVMGADMQPQGQVQTLLNMLDFAMNPYDAGAAPRIRHDGLNAPHSTQISDAGIVYPEAAISEKIVSALRSCGHTVRAATDPVEHFMGGYQCVRREAEGYSGASEPRFDGCALGVG